MIRTTDIRALGALATVLALASMMALAPGTAAQDGAQPATSLLDLSGLAAVDVDRFVAVHDAKNPGENDRPRLSLITQTNDERGIVWEELPVTWPEEMGPASDLESASAIPGSSLLIAAESGDDGSSFQRLFLVELGAPEVEGDDSDVATSASIVGVTTWPSPVFNVEGMGVALSGGQLVLVYAERAEGRSRTRLQWAPLTLEPFEVGEPRGRVFRSPAAEGPNDRPIVAIDAASDGRIFVASAFDPGDDGGPFASSVWLAGRVVSGPDGPEVRVRQAPRRVARLDALKVESLVVVPGDPDPRILVGTDDEDYGGILRPLP